MGMTEHAWRALGRQIRRPTGLFGRALGRLMAWEHRDLSAWAIEQLAPESADRIVDLGCGGGAAVAALASLVRDGHVIGVDYSAEMVRQARRRVRRIAGVGRIDIVQGSVDGLPLQDASVQRALSVESFFFWNDPQSALREVRRVLKPGGRLAIVMESSRESPNAEKAQAVSALLNLRFYSGAEMVELLRTAGFSKTWYHTFPERDRGWLCALATR